MSHHHNHNSEIHHEHVTDNGHHHSSGFVGWKLLLALVPLFFGIWLTINTFTNQDILYPFMKNPWWAFSWATITLLILGKDFLTPLWISVKQLKVNISTFLAFSIVLSYVYSLVYMGIYYNNYDLFIEYSMFESTIEIMVIVYLGYFIEDIVTKKSKKDLNLMQDFFSKDVILLKNGREIIVKPKDLIVGDTVIIKNGDYFPVDGIVLEGISIVNEATFTGESIPIKKIPGSKAFGGTISEGEKILFEVTSTLENSLISKVISGIKNTENQNLKTQKISNILEKYVINFIFFAGLIGLLSWGFIVGWNKGIEVFITTIIVACPMAFVLLTPTASLISSSIAAKKGIIFNSPDLFEKFNSIDAIVFDKTGTLTEGNLKVVNFTIPNDFLPLIKNMESVSTHPIATSIVSYIKSKEVLNIKSSEIIGSGVKTTLNGDNYYFGSYSFVSTYKKFEELETTIKCKKEGSIFSYLVKNDNLIGFIELKDNIKESAYKVIKYMQENNIATYLFTGDNEYTSKYIAEKINIPLENIQWELKPFDKVESVKKLQSDGKTVAFVGDGMNDSIALKQAEIGISIGTGSSLAIESSDITLQFEDLGLIITSLIITKKTLNVILSGFVIAIIYIILAVSIALTGFISPFIGAIFMVINDLVPVIWSTRLFKLRKLK